MRNVLIWEQRFLWDRIGGLAGANTKTSTKQKLIISRRCIATSFVDAWYCTARQSKERSVDGHGTAGAVFRDGPYKIQARRNAERRWAEQVVRDRIGPEPGLSTLKMFVVAWLISTGEHLRILSLIEVIRSWDDQPYCFLWPLIKLGNFPCD